MSDTKERPGRLTQPTNRRKHARCLAAYWLGPSAVTTRGRATKHRIPPQTIEASTRVLSAHTHTTSTSQPSPSLLTVQCSCKQKPAKTRKRTLLGNTMPERPSSIGGSSKAAKSTAMSGTKAATSAAYSHSCAAPSTTTKLEVQFGLPWTPSLGVSSFSSYVGGGGTGLGVPRLDIARELVVREGDGLGEARLGVGEALGAWFRSRRTFSFLIGRTQTHPTPPPPPGTSVIETIKCSSNNLVKTMSGILKARPRSGSASLSRSSEAHTTRCILCTKKVGVDQT